MLTVDETVNQEDAVLFSCYLNYRNSLGKSLEPEEIPQILVDMSIHLDCFVAKIFGIEQKRDAQAPNMGF